MLIGFGNHVNKGFLAVTSLINWQKNHCIIPGWHCKYSAWKEPLENISWPYPHWQANLKTTHVSQTASNPPSTAKGVGILSIHFGFVWFVSKNSDSFGVKPHFPYDLLATNFGVPTQFSGSKPNELMVNIPHDVRIISPFFMVKSCYHCTQTFWKLFSSEKKVATIQHVWMWLCLWLMDVYGGIGWSNSHHSPGHHISKWTKWDQGTEVEVELVEELLLELLLVLVLVIVVELLLVEVLPKRFVGWSRLESERTRIGSLWWMNME